MGKEVKDAAHYKEQSHVNANTIKLEVRRIKKCVNEEVKCSHIDFPIFWQLGPKS